MRHGFAVYRPTALLCCTIKVSQISFMILTKKLLKNVFTFLQRFRGRKRNCYTIAIRYVHKALMRSNYYRKYKKQQAKQVSLYVPLKGKENAWF